MVKQCFKQSEQKLRKTHGSHSHLVYSSRSNSTKNRLSQIKCRKCYRVSSNFKTATHNLYIIIVEPYKKILFEKNTCFLT